MTEGEIDLFRWFEVFTLGGKGGLPIPEDDARGRMAAARKYVEPIRGTANYGMSAAGWEWFAVRSQRIAAACAFGSHVARPKKRFGTELFCIWCGVKDEAEVPEPGLHEPVRGGVEVRLSIVPEVEDVA